MGDESQQNRTLSRKSVKMPECPLG